MRARINKYRMSRREFVRQSAAAAGLAGLAGLSLDAGGEANAAADAKANPFAYDVSRQAKTDPALIKYREVCKIPCPQPNPRRIAVGPDGRIYVAGGRYISVLSPEAGPVSEIALDADASCVAVSPSGEAFVGLRKHIEVFDRKGQRRARWDSPGQRAWLTGLAIAGDSIFAADAGARVLLRYDANGKVEARLGEKNKERNVPGFIVPSPFFDVEMHSDGLLRVTNPGRHRVEVYTTSGDFELAWGKPSLAIEGFCGCCNPINIALLPDGRVVTCEKGMPRVKVYAADGTFECVVAGPESFPENARVCTGDADCTKGGLDCATDSQGRIYVLDMVSADIRVMMRKAS